MMKDFDFKLVNPDIEKYIEKLSTTEDKIIKNMELYAVESEVPIVGPLVGRFLYLLVLISGAKEIFELGSGFGYSAYWFSKALSSNGRIICTDYSKDHKKTAEDFFKAACIPEKLEFLTGNSLKILDGYNGVFDIVFNDVDKEYYPDVIDIAHEKLRAGGMLVTDNVLWYGKVIVEDGLPSTKGVKKFNELIASDTRFFTTVIPLRDGLSVSVKLS